ncbi:hypothetical protein BIW11_12244 [Tropilaelaps mercedesae]|uniref:Uncharacterized protein n=1 Tax=Tropilaelaps mercedesae TaxID=418985 RepID=A0A1V9X796_9ACAR|nr:hypothetical protein BIW11_12244 [Tropilaelaps mercedesae]
MSVAHHTGRPATRRSSLPRYDLRRRVLVSNLNRHVQPLSQATRPVMTALPSKSCAAPLDLIKDLPNGGSTTKRVKMHCISSHPATVTPEKKPETKFRIDPSVLRKQMAHTPIKAAPPKRRRSDGPLRDTISLHLLKEDYRPLVKKDRLELSLKESTVLANPTVATPPRNDKPPEGAIATKPVPLPRKSKMGSSSSCSTGSRPESAASSSVSSNSDPLYARIENCTTGSKQDFVKYGYVDERAAVVAPAEHLATGSACPQASSVLRDCTDGRKRKNLLLDEDGIRLRPRLSSTSSGECRARKSLLFSDGVDTTRAPAGLTLKNIYASEKPSESPLVDTLSRIPSPPDDRCPRSQPRVLSQSGIYSNNTLVVESKKLKKHDVDRSYGFTCRMRPMLRALSDRKTPQTVLPSKFVKRDMELDTPLKSGHADKAPPLPPPRTAVLPHRQDQAPKNSLLDQKRGAQPELTAPTTPNREVAIQTSFLVHDAGDCPVAIKESAKKRRRSLEIIAEVGAKVKRRTSMVRDKICKSLDLTPGKAVRQEISR